MRHLGYLALITALAFTCKKLMVLSGTNWPGNFMWSFICYVNLFMFYVWIFALGIYSVTWGEEFQEKKIFEIKKLHHAILNSLYKDISGLEKEIKTLREEKQLAEMIKINTKRRLDEEQIKQTRSASQANHDALQSFL